jgi:hypothetical protein
VSRNEKRIREVAAELGIYVESLRWEPIGMDFEMCGRSGGWILNGFESIGLSTEEAIKYLRKWPSHFESIAEHEDEWIEEESEHDAAKEK